MATYEKGDAYDDVARIQTALGVAADGKFGAVTDKAARVWQRDNGMTADGTIGPDMLLALGLADLVLLENGDTGALVERVQQELGLAVDGEYGDDTERAVKAYQKQNRLKANGVADMKTLQSMQVLDAQGAASISRPKGPESATKGRSAPKIAPVEQPAPATAGTASGGSIRSWAYQLADIDPQEIAALPVDLVVIDYAADCSAATAFQRADVARMKTRSGGAPKKLISYMSIGEAETYRYYWQDSWSAAATKPAWLDDENPDWAGNFKVRFWDPAWQAVILGNPSAYLDKIIAAGFDGVYLDIIDGFEYWRDDKQERLAADQDMIAFVKKIAAYARRQRPDFMIIPQNGEALLEDASYRAVISAQGKEDVFYGIDGDGRANKKQAVNDCLECLAPARAAGIPILIVEYLNDGKKIADARSKLSELGCPAYFGPRDLASIPVGQFKG
jgi:cysteinyl-tRNA synthetase, unknown class